MRLINTILAIVLLFSCNKKENYSSIQVIGHAGMGLAMPNSMYHDNSKEAIENFSDESKQDLAQSSWDTFLVWDKYIIYILTAFAVINIISIYFIWRNSKTNIREALNNFLNDQISHASLDNELANILAKDAAIVVLNKYFEDKGKPLIESKFKYYKKPLSYYLL